MHSWTLYFKALVKVTYTGSPIITSVTLLVDSQVHLHDHSISVLNSALLFNIEKKELTGDSGKLLGNDSYGGCYQMCRRHFVGHNSLRADSVGSSMALAAV